MLCGALFHVTKTGNSGHWTIATMTSLTYHEKQLCLLAVRRFTSLRTDVTRRTRQHGGSVPQRQPTPRAVASTANPENQLVLAARGVLQCIARALRHSIQISLTLLLFAYLYLPFPSGVKPLLILGPFFSIFHPDFGI